MWLRADQSLGGPTRGFGLLVATCFERLRDGHVQGLCNEWHPPVTGLYGRSPVWCCVHQNGSSKFGTLACAENVVSQLPSPSGEAESTYGDTRALTRHMINCKLDIVETRQAPRLRPLTKWLVIAHDEATPAFYEDHATPASRNEVLARRPDTVGGGIASEC